ncbi:hypothetical protein JXM67_02335 [candidate division WOR-3 bacterium]|nr:hypothetical protein [candidate division WOR-3 bacterium]
MRYGRIIVVTVFIIIGLIPQTTQAGWMRAYGKVEYGETGYSVCQTEDGGFFLAGDFHECPPPPEWIGADLWLIRTDENGDTLWTRTYGGGGHDEARCMQKTNDGGYIITGFVNGNIDWPFGGDLLLLKVDSLGNKLWDRVYGGSYYSIGNWVEQTTDGGYIVTGDYNDAYLWLLKTDEDGVLVWQDTFDAGGHEVGRCVQQTSDGGYIVTGSWCGNVPLLKFDQNGDSLWFKLYDLENSIIGRCVRQTSEGGYIISGQWNYGELWLLKTDDEGDSLWAKIYGGGEKMMVIVFYKLKMVII